MSIVIRDLNLKAAQSDDYTYSDLDIYQLKGTRNELALKDFDAIRSSINNIFLVKRGSRILDPEFGSNLDIYLFEQINDSNANSLAEDVEEILTQEPRILVESINVTVDEVGGQYIVEIYFYVPSLSKEALNSSFTLSKDNGLVINSLKVNK